MGNEDGAFEKSGIMFTESRSWLVKRARGIRLSTLKGNGELNMADRARNPLIERSETGRPIICAARSLKRTNDIWHRYNAPLSLYVQDLDLSFHPSFSTVRSGVKEVATFSDIEGLRETILYRLTIYIYYCEISQAMESTIDIFYLF